MNNDLINGAFEFFGGILLWLNVWKLIKDKQVKGILLSVSLFFAAWSIWNIYYYPNIGQFFSFLGAICLALANTVWIILAFYYKIVDKDDFFR